MGISKLTWVPAVEHPTGVVTLGRRVSAVMLTLALVAGHAAECAGWAATPEARMACCADGAACPMHKSDSSGSHDHGELSQAQADSCCAFSGRDASAPSLPTLALPISAAVAGTPIKLPAETPALVLSDAWRSVTPPPAGSVPKHVLLSVFLL